MCGFTVRGLEIGGGNTRICVPVMPRTLGEFEEILGKLDVSEFDILEWRADALQGASLADYIEGLEKLRRGLGHHMPLLFTLRTSAEGGGYSGTADACASIIAQVAQSGVADMVDIELSTGDENVRAVVDAAKAAGVKVIVSHHNFSGIYNPEEIADMYRRMFVLGADIAKIALMPKNVRECMAVMDAAAGESLCPPHRALIMVGMGRHGVASRIMAREIGSCITFGYTSAAGASAPGQISACDLREIMEITKKYTVS